MKLRVGKKSKKVRWGGGFLAAALILFLYTGLWPSWQTPQHKIYAAKPQTKLRGPLRLMTYNIAKAYAWEEPFWPASQAALTQRLDKLAEVINAENPHVVCLTETVAKGLLCAVDQTTYLAEKTQMHGSCFGAFYKWGFPFAHVSSGNAVLSRLPLRPLKVQALPGQGHVFYPMGQRRVLWCEIQINGTWYRLGCVRTDSFDLKINTAQTRLLLEETQQSPAFLAGDFNAGPQSDSLIQLKQSDRFSGAFQGPPTFPSAEPKETIDYIFAPKAFMLLEHRVLDLSYSDHLPVVSVFSLPK